MNNGKDVFSRCSGALELFVGQMVNDKLIFNANNLALITLPHFGNDRVIKKLKKRFKNNYQCVLIKMNIGLSY